MAAPFIVFPTTLFAKPFVPTTLKHPPSQFIILEESSLIYNPKYRPLRVNKNKIALFRATLKAYTQKLKKQYPNAQVKYIEYKDALTFKPPPNSNAWDPTDDVIRERYKGLITFHESPAFLLSNADIHALKATRLTAIYDHLRSKLHILENTKSTDAQNRKPIPPSLAIPTPPTYKHAEITAAISYANTPQFSKHVGDPSNLKYSPVTHEQAATHLEFFINRRFKNFGEYQDAVSTKHTHLFHANISHLLNIGLLTPQQVLDAIMKKKTHVPLNSLEGFVRQLIGWREYQRYLYEKHKSEIMAPFKTQSTTKLDPHTWTTTIAQIDNEISKAKATGYAHHIVRLMYFLNIMKLLEIPPRAIYAWFMEVVSIDAYDWVMYSNIASMGFYTKIQYMTKPYISTSAYATALSDYKERSPLWDALFYSYIHRNQKKLTGGAKAYLRNLSAFNKMPISKQKEFLSLARNHIDRR